MSGINDKATVTLQVNGTQAKQMMADIEKKIKDTEQAIIKLKQSNADPKDIEKQRKLLKNYTKQLDEMRSATEGVNKALKSLDAATPRQLEKAIKTLNKQLKDLKPGTAAWDEHKTKIQQLTAQLNALKQEIKGQESLWQRFTKWWFQCGQAVAALVMGYQQLINTLRGYVDDYASMDQEMANVRKFTGMTANEVHALNESFKEIDTRTSREELNKLAQEAGRLGLSSQKDVLGFVRAADKINVALDDLGEGATLTLSKLTDMFGDRERYGVEQSLLKTGSVINELSQTSSAAAPYIANFAERLSGVGIQANLTVPQIMALGAVLDSNSQKVEASATAISQILVRMMQDPAKYARVAGLEVKEFTKLLRTDANEALLVFLDTLNKAGGLDVLAPMFKEMGETGARAINALSTLADNIDLVRQRQREANIAFEEGTSIDKEFAVQNTTVQASIEKAKKRFQELRVELGEKLTPLMRYFMTSASALAKALNVLVDFIIEHKVALVALTVTLAAYTAAVKMDVIATKAATVATKAWAALQKALPGILAVSRVAVAALTNTVRYFTNGLEVNYAMQQRWRNAMAKMSFNNWAGLVMGCVAAVTAWIISLKKAVNIQDELADIHKKAMSNAAEEINRIEALRKVAEDETAALEDRKKVIAELNRIIPDYNGQLDETSGKYKANKDALDKYIDSLVRLYEIEGAKEKLRDIGKQKAELNIEKAELNEQLKTEREIYRQQLENAQSQPQTSSGAVPAQSVYANAEQAATIRTLESEVEKKDEKIKELEKTENIITKTYGADILISEQSDSTEVTVEEEGKVGGNGYASVTLSEKEKRRKELEAKRELAKAKLTYRDRMEGAKGDWEADSAKNIVAYSQGLTTYEDYIAEKERIDIKYIEDRIKIYNSLYENETDENKKLLLMYDEDYQELLLKKAELERKHEEERNKTKVAALKREQKIEEDLINLNALTPDNELYGDEVAQQEQLYQVKIKYLRKYRDVYKQGSKEWMEYERQIVDAENARMLEKRKMYAKKLEEWRKGYEYLTLKSRMDMELKILDEMLKKKLISEEEYMRIKADLERKYQSETTSSSNGKIDYLSSSELREAKASSRKKDKENDMAELRKKYDDGLIDEKTYQQGRRNIEKYYSDLMFDDIRSGLDDQTKMLFGLGVVWADFFKNIADGGRISFEDIGNIAKNTFAVMSAGLELYGEFAAAQSRIEIANTQKKYDKEIEAMQGNTYKTAKLEKKRDAEIAKLKAAATKKEFNIKVAQAVAQTAQNALAAYGAGLQAGFPQALWLAPLLAGIATATGLVQVALLKKQQKAAETEGYAEGGFTKPGSKYEPAGIVHAGEWVASQKLLANPSARALIEQLDYVQRTNTIGSLRSEDVSMAITAPQSLARIMEGDASSALMVAAVAKSAEAVKELSARLKEPIAAITTVTGDYGINKAQEEYASLLRNITPKSKHK